MKLECYRYVLPLARPLQLKGVEVRVREGIIVRLVHPEGVVGFGDAAPLPGFSHETVEETLEHIVEWSAITFNTLSREEKQTRLRRFMAKSEQVRAALFGVEQASLDILAQRQGIHDRHLPFENRRDRVRVNALIVNSEHLSESVEQAAAGGYPAVKLKVGRRPVEEDIERIRSASAELGNAMPFRLDANRAWSYHQAVTFCRGIEGLPVDYIEEPLDDPLRLEELRGQCSIPLAADESVIEESRIEPLISWASVVILKPTLLFSGLSHARLLAREASRYGIRPVISSCFESGLGVAALVNLAASLDIGDTPMGLDTYQWLAEDVLDRRFSLRDGAYSVSEVNACVDTLNTDRLEGGYHE